eukprot:2042051-Pyramimonas_sp.AAC.1
MQPPGPFRLVSNNRQSAARNEQPKLGHYLLGMHLIPPDKTPSPQLVQKAGRRLERVAAAPADKERIVD